MSTTFARRSASAVAGAEIISANSSLSNLSSTATLPLPDVNFELTTDSPANSLNTSMTDTEIASQLNRPMQNAQQLQQQQQQQQQQLQLQQLQQQQLLQQQRGHQHQPTMVAVASSAAVVPVQQDALSDTMEKMRIGSLPPSHNPFHISLILDFCSVKIVMA